MPQLPNILLLPWLLCDYYGLKRDMKLPRYRAMVFLISLLGFTVPLFHAPPLTVMIASQVFSALILPITVLSILYLTSKKSIMGEHVNRPLTNIVLSVILFFAIYMCGTGIRGLWTTIF